MNLLRGLIGKALRYNVPKQGVIRDQKFEVKSSNIRSLKYGKDNSLTVWFTTGQVYRYDNVPEEVVHTLIASDSIGSYFYKNVRNKFPYTNLSEEK